MTATTTCPTQSKQAELPLLFCPATDRNSPVKTWTYLSEGEAAEGHTPVYKLHKYFARRPQNVFRRLIKHYTRPGDVIFDPFCGGGVTVFEGIAEQRRVYAQDLNPLAVFVTRCQATAVDIDEYDHAMTQIRKEFYDFSREFYQTRSRRSGQPVQARWYDYAFSARCSVCGQPVILSNKNKAAGEHGALNGFYGCPSCGRQTRGVDAEKMGHRLLSVTYDCPISGRRETYPADEGDFDLVQQFESRDPDIIKRLRLWYPRDEIPGDWDRAHEDCLHRKGITHFADLFTRRNLTSNAFLLKRIRSFKGSVAPLTYDVLLLTFSATLTYTNIMTISTDQWMDGRPVAWSKHAFWIPYQFVETNPNEFLRKRHKGFLQGLRFAKRKLIRADCVDSFDALLSNGTHVVRCGSSRCVELPDESVHAVITDPPYGSNVQYGELSAFWLVWLKDELSLPNPLTSFSDEAVVHRKANAKTHSTYYETLHAIFTECHRVLKGNGPLVFTFNNKDIRTLFCVLKAAIDAGFVLEPEGIIYQEPIEIYKNTAHQRFSGTLHGDFIYTFKKSGKRIPPSVKGRRQLTLADAISSECRLVINENKNADSAEVSLKVIGRILPILAKACDTEGNCEEQLKALGVTDIDSLIGKFSPS